jgi:hypothetical protein
MELDYLIEIKKVQTGLKGEFYSVVLSNNKYAMMFTTNGNRYIIHESLKNFSRFEKWDKKEVIADIQKTGKKIRLFDGTKVPLIRIKVNVTFTNED